MYIKSSLGSTILVSSLFCGFAISYVANSLSSGTEKKKPQKLTNVQTFRKSKVLRNEENKESNILTLSNSGEAEHLSSSSSTQLPPHPLHTKHVTIRGLFRKAGEEYPFGLKVEGKYVPIAWSDSHIEIAVKGYSKRAREEVQSQIFAPASRFIQSLKTNDEVEVKGPIVSISSSSSAEEDLIMRSKKNIVFLVGGSGITPVLQFLFRLGMRTEQDPPIPYENITIICSTRSADEIIGKKQLDSYAKQHGSKIKIVHTLTRKAPSNWGGDKGRVSKDMVEKHLPLCSPDDTVVCICGPDGFAKAMMEGVVKQLGWKHAVVL